MRKKTSRLTISLVEGTPEHDWLYGMNQIQRGFAAQHALRVYHQLIASGQISMFAPGENIVIAPAQPAPVVALGAPVAPVPVQQAPVVAAVAPMAHQAEPIVDQHEQVEEAPAEPVEPAVAVATPAVSHDLLADFY